MNNHGNDLFLGRYWTTGFSWTNRTSWKKSKFICLTRELIHFVTEFLYQGQGGGVGRKGDKGIKGVQVS
jgi:hypothetical protein